MNPNEYSIAWDHPDTRRAWTMHTLLIAARFLGWVGVWLATLFITVGYIIPPYVIVAIPLLVYAFFRAFLQIVYFPSSLNLRRILREYPWQFLTDIPRDLGKHPEETEDGMWFEFDDPGRPERKIPMIFLTQIRTRWWIKRIGGPRTSPELKAEIEPLWFAGDPRFVAVVAAPSGRGGAAPKRMHVLYQRPCLGRRGAVFKWSADPASLERARRAGARVPNPDELVQRQPD